MFENANRNVTRHSYGRKEMTSINNTSPSVLARQSAERKAVMENHTMIDQQVEEIEANLPAKAAQEARINAAILENQIPRMVDKLYNEGRTLLFKHILTESFMDALVLDKSFVQTQEQTLASVVESYIDQNGGYSMLTEAYKKTKSPILKAVMTICEEVSRKVSTRKGEQAKAAGSVTDFNFELNDDEKNELDYGKGNTNLDQVSALVKDKVMTVVQEEKEREQREQELQDDLQAQADSDGTTVEEAMRKYVIPRGNVGTIEESTLFNSIFRHTLKVTLEASATNQAAHSYVYNQGDGDEAEADTDAYTDTDDIKQNEFQPYRAEDAMSSEYSLQREIDQSEPDGGASIDDNMHQLDMELVLAESIVRYTLMEMFHTTKLETFTQAQLRNISQKALN